MPMAAEGDMMAHEDPAAPAFAEESFFEYHLYTLDRRATVAENETKQMQLLSAASVPLKKTFLLVGQNWWYRGRQGDLGHDLPVGVYLELQNKQAGGLGKPLPAGTDPRLQAGQLGRPAVHRRGRDQAHAQGRDQSTSRSARPSTSSPRGPRPTSRTSRSATSTSRSPSR
jgi:hypothetical protein